MRIALLSVQHPATDPLSVPAPFRMIAGARLIERQLDLALAAGCETIAVLAPTMGKELLALQHRAEDAGARLMFLTDPHKLSGVVTADDEILAIEAGLLPEEGQLLRQLARPGILIFPQDPAVGLGYERIDANFAWAGVLLGRGTLVEQLAQLPDDIDPHSALLRIALQTGLRTRPLEVSLLDEHKWLRDPDAVAIAERERSWVADHASVAPFHAPGLAIAERMGARLLRDSLGGNLPRLLLYATAIATALSLGTAVAGWVLPAFGFALVTSILLAMDEVVRRITFAGQVKPRVPALYQALKTVFDPVLAILVALASPEDTEWLRLFVPVILFGLLHLGERLSTAKWRRTYADRVLVTLLLIPGVVFGVAQPVAAVLCLLVLITILLTSPVRD